MDYNVGDMVRYKMVAGRGRPGVGVIMRRAGLFVEIQNQNSQEVKRISPSKIISPHVFTPYVTKGRLAQAEAEG